MSCNISPEIWYDIVCNPDQNVVSTNGIPVNLISLSSADPPP